VLLTTVDIVEGQQTVLACIARVGNKLQATRVRGQGLKIIQKDQMDKGEQD